MNRSVFRRARAVAPAVVVLSLVLAACSGGSGDERTDPVGFADVPEAAGPVDSLTWAVRSEPPTLDSKLAFGTDSLSILSNVCEPLVELQDDGTTEPLLASSIDEPDDTTIVIGLRDDVTFADGTPMTADDVVFSLQRVIDPASGSFFGAYAHSVAAVEKTDDRTVTITMSRPDPIFVQMLATPLGHVVKQSAVEAAGEAYGTPAAPPVCTGPYQVASWTQGTSITLEPNPEWWQDDERLTQEATFVFLADDATVTSGLLTGDIDGTHLATVSSMPALEESGDLNVYSGPSTAFHSLVVAGHDGPMSDASLREAVSKIIDYEGTSDVLLKGYAEPLKSIVPPGLWGAQAETYEAAYEDLPEMAQDLDGARKLIEESGIEDPTITLAVPGYLGDFRAFAESFQATAKEVGLTVELALLPRADFLALFSDPQAQAQVDLFYTDYVGFIPDPTELVTALGLPGGPANFGGYENSEVTGLLEEALQTLDGADRADLVSQAQELIMADLPWIPFAYQHQVLVLNQRLAGVSIASPQYTYTAWLPRTGSSK